MSDPEEWAKGFARQARADFETWDRLQGIPETPECHRLLFLQMACEKPTKAHLCKAGSDPALVKRRGRLATIGVPEPLVRTSLPHLGEPQRRQDRDNLMGLEDGDGHGSAHLDRLYAHELRLQHGFAIFEQHGDDFAHILAQFIQLSPWEWAPGKPGTYPI